MQLLAEFLARLSIGMSAAMLLVSPRQVTSGYYRNNLYVLLGLNVLASLVAWTMPANSPIAVWPFVAAAVASYLGAVAWLYEKARLGLVILTIVAVASVTGTWLSQRTSASGVDFVSSQATEAVTKGILTHSATSKILWAVDPVCGGLLLGVTTAAMLLGHWYLNAPGMPLAPLRKLVALMTAAIVLRALVAGAGLALHPRAVGAFDLSQWLFVAMRWLTGIVGAAVVALMARQTLKIPNTQSATGILYVGVVLTFVGELTAELLSRGEPFPL
jgi:hypothetical protein